MLAIPMRTVMAYAIIARLVIARVAAVDRAKGVVAVMARAAWDRVARMLTPMVMVYAIIKGVALVAKAAVADKAVAPAKRSCHAA